MTEQVKQAHITTLLSLTTGYLLSPPGEGNGMSELQALVEFVVGHPVWTHQLPREVKPAAEHLLKLHPWLAEVEMPNGFDGPEHAERFAIGVAEKHGVFFDVTAIQGGTKAVNPLTELKEMVGDRKIVVVTTD